MREKTVPALATLLGLACVDLARPSEPGVGVDADSPTDTEAPPEPDASVPDAASSTCLPTSSTRIGHWRLDDGAGRVAKDSSCSGNHAHLIGFTGAPTWVTAGRIGGALDLDGSKTYLSVPYTASFEPLATAITVAAWVYRKASQVGKYGTIAHRQAGNTSAEDFALFFDPNNHLVLWTRNGSPCTEMAVSPVDRWIHVAATFDGTTGRIYRDGVMVCSGVKASPLGPDTTPVTFGTEIDDTIGTPIDFLPATLDEILLYGRVLQASEIAGLAAGGSPPD